MQTGVRLALVLWLVGAAASPAAAAITFIEIRRTEPFAGGATFGGTGAYVKVVGVAHGELDPAIPGNRGIVNLERAPRNERGRVEYDVDFYVLSPADSSRGNRRILYEVTSLARNAHSAAPALRALLVALDAWVVDGTRPPRNRIPLLRDATLVDAARLGFPAIPGTEAPRAANRIAPFDDWVAPKPDTARAYVTLVTKVDADGNEMTGIRLPGVAAPLGTHTGWNFYRAPQLAGELCDRDGTFVPFAVTKAEREAAKDPRLSLEERYKDHKGWLAYVRAVAYDLMRERVLLKEDGDRIVAAAEAADPFKR